MSWIVRILAVLALLSCALSLSLHTGKIDIEYCGACGYGGPAKRVRDSILKAFPNDKVNSHSANSKTGTIKVSWVKGGNLATVWNKGKAETETGHSQIIDLLKKSK